VWQAGEENVISARKPARATAAVAMAFPRDPDMMAPWVMRFADFRVMKAADLRGVLVFVSWSRLLK
jgi:hypothetical protein